MRCSPTPILRAPVKGKRSCIEKSSDFSLHMSCRQSYHCRFFIGIRLQSSLCQTPIRIEAAPRDQSPKRALPFYSGPENLRLRAGSNSFFTIPMVLTPVLRWLPVRAVYYNTEVLPAFRDLNPVGHLYSANNDYMKFLFGPPLSRNLARKLTTKRRKTCIYIRGALLLLWQ